MSGFADALRTDKFIGVHFKRWQVKVHLWLTILHVWEARLVFVGCVISVLHDRLVDVYMHITDVKEL